MDNLEKAKVMRAKESFATTKEYSSHSYITTENRKKARKLNDVLPSKFELRTPQSYQTDLTSLKKGKDSRSIKEDSVFNQLPFFHVCQLGAIPPCVSHDAYQGKIIFDLKDAARTLAVQGIILMTMTT